MAPDHHQFWSDDIHFYSNLTRLSRYSIHTNAPGYIFLESRILEWLCPAWFFSVVFPLIWKRPHCSLTLAANEIVNYCWCTHVTDLYLLQVTLPRVHLFTFIQLLCFIVLWIVKTVDAISIAFPVMVNSSLILTGQVSEIRACWNPETTQIIMHFPSESTDRVWISLSSWWWWLSFGNPWTSSSLNTSWKHLMTWCPITRSTKSLTTKKKLAW